MTDDNKPRGMTRRSVLRRGAVTAGAVTLGVSGFSGSALASFCPRTPGYWANHDWCEVLIDPGGSTKVWECLTDDGDCQQGEADGTYTLAGVEKPQIMWQAFLTDPVRGDKAAIMGKAALATALNFCRIPGKPCEAPAADCDVEGSCAYEKLDLSEYGIEKEMNVAQVKNTAFDWLRASSWGEGGKQRSWTVEIDGESIDGEPYKDVLDAFNNGRLNASDCFCDDTGEE